MRTALLILGVLTGITGIILFAKAMVAFQDLGESEKRMGLFDVLTGGWICAFRGASRHWRTRPDLRRLVYLGLSLPVFAVIFIKTIASVMAP